MTDIVARNRPYLAPAETSVRKSSPSYNTTLAPLDEMAFRQWVAQNNVPFNPDASVTDYDMRGFWLALKSGDPRAQTAINPNDKQLHFPDTWKTPNHETFSNESQWAAPTAPQWNGQDQLVAPSGRILKDERVVPNEFIPEPAFPTTRLGRISWGRTGDIASDAVPEQKASDLLRDDPHIMVPREPPADRNTYHPDDVVPRIFEDV